MNFVFVVYTKLNVQLQTAGRLLWVCQMWNVRVYSVCGWVQSKATLSPFRFFSLMNKQVLTRRHGIFFCSTMRLLC